MINIFVYFYFETVGIEMKVNVWCSPDIDDEEVIRRAKEKLNEFSLHCIPIQDARIYV